MENQVNDNVKDIKDALDGMVLTVAVAVNPSRSDLLKLGGVAIVGAAIGSAGYLAITKWMERRKFKKSVDEIYKQN